jgi:hypothetical protein
MKALQAVRHRAVSSKRLPLSEPLQWSGIAILREALSRVTPPTPPVPGTEPRPKPDPEPQPGSEPDVIPPVNPEPEPDTTPDVVPPEPEPAPM